jgi:hypothetical protein
VLVVKAVATETNFQRRGSESGINCDEIESSTCASWGSNLS